MFKEIYIKHTLETFVIDYLLWFTMEHNLARSQAVCIYWLSLNE